MVYLRLMEEYALQNNVPIMMSDGIDFLTKYIKEHNVKNILELGSAIGYSAIRMSLVSDDIHVTTLERDEDRYKEALKNISAMQLDNQIDVVCVDALEFETNDFYDLIFIDAAKSQYIKFFEKYKDNLKSDGTIISDNLEFHGLVKDVDSITNRNTRQLVKKISKYVDFLKNNNEFNTVFLSVGDGIGISRRKDC